MLNLNNNGKLVCVKSRNPFVFFLDRGQNPDLIKQIKYCYKSKLNLYTKELLKSESGEHSYIEKLN